MWVLQLALAVGVQALNFEASGTSDAVQVQAELVNGLESRVEAAESRARELLAQRDDARKHAAAAEKAAAEAGKSLQAEEDKNSKWHEVANNLQDQVQAAFDAKTAAEAKAKAEARKAAEDEATVAAEAKVAAEAQAQVKNIGHTAEEKGHAVDEEHARAERAQKAQAVAEAAAKHAAQTVSQLKADLQSVREEAAEKAAHLATAEASVKETEKEAAEEVQRAQKAAAEAEHEAAAKAAEVKAEEAAEQNATVAEQAAKNAEAAKDATDAEKAKLARVLQTKLADLDAAEDTVAAAKKKATDEERSLEREELRNQNEEREVAAAKDETKKAEEERSAAAVAQEKAQAEAANATAKTTAAKAAAEEAMDAAKESHRALVQRLHEISELQDQVSVWQQRTRNVSHASTVTAGRQKLALKRALADKSDLTQQLKKLKGDLATARMEHAKELREAKKAAKAAAKEQELAEQEAAVVDKARRAVAEAKEDTKEEHVVRELAEKKLATLSQQNRQLAERVAELQENLDIRARAETNVRATLLQSNSSLSAEKQQVLLLQKRTATLEAMEKGEAAQRKEVENERAQIEGQAEELKDKLAAAQGQVTKQTDELADVKGRWKQAEANENEYFDSMTSLQSAKDDLSQQLADSQKAAADAKTKADDLEKTNEYLRGEQQSTDAAGQAAMSDYLKEIEQMKLEEEKQQATIAQQAAQEAQLHQAAADLWKELTPAQRKQMQARAKKAAVAR